MPATQRGNDFAGYVGCPSGAQVFYDPSEGDASGGVFVSWRPSTELMEAALAAGTLDSPAAVIGGSAMDAMLVAIDRMLVAAGWTVDSEALAFTNPR